MPRSCECGGRASCKSNFRRPGHRPTARARNPACTPPSRNSSRSTACPPPCNTSTSCSPPCSTPRTRPQPTEPSPCPRAKGRRVRSPASSGRSGGTTTPWHRSRRGRGPACTRRGRRHGIRSSGSRCSLDRCSTSSCGNPSRRPSTPSPPTWPTGARPAAARRATVCAFRGSCTSTARCKSSSTRPSRRFFRSRARQARRSSVCRGSSSPAPHSPSTPNRPRRVCGGPTPCKSTACCPRP
mmetsp:Transcript_118517/g.340313  ORF Transcript_118517/g.340313 Transcript_118517/m.340313 type:complete len:240 (-) Transcript_118517:636-1355(-)